MRKIFPILFVLLFISGCSGILPTQGTRAVFEADVDGVIPRKQISQLTSTLGKRCDLVLGTQNARVESVKRNRLVLHIPDKHVSKSDVEKLLDESTLRMYHLENVATNKEQSRLWKIGIPKGSNLSYTFTRNDNDDKLNSDKNPQRVLREVVGAPETSPLFTARDIEPAASYIVTGKRYAVKIRFKEDSAKRFQDFSRKNPGEYVAIFFQGKLLSAPRIDKPITGVEAYITGFISREEAKHAVDEISSGTYPVKLKLISVEQFGN